MVRDLGEVLAAETAARERAWAALRQDLDPAGRPQHSAHADLASLVLDDPAGRPWRPAGADLAAPGLDDPAGRIRGTVDAELASLVLDHPAAHLWRTVDAALDRMVCPRCGAGLGAGVRGCDPCDFADGSRFLGQEPDRPGVPRGNEHAIRVALTLIRFPHRWPAHAVAGARVFLPLFDSGQMPTRAEQMAVVEATQAGRSINADSVTTFAELAARAR